MPPLPLPLPLACPQLEESNRTLTVDVANLANEKEELNNQLKELQQRKPLTLWASFTNRIAPISGVK